MQTTQVFNITAQPAAVPPSARLIAVLPAALAGSLAVSPLPGRAGGNTYVLPSGTPAGAYRLPIGGTALPTWATLSNSADAVAGACIVVAPGTEAVGEFPGAHTAWHWDTDHVWPWAFKALGPMLTSSRAVFAAGALTNLGAALAGAATLAVTVPLAGAATIAWAGGATQVVAAGFSGLVALNSPIAAGCTLSLTNATDWSDASDVLAIGTRV